MIRKLNPEDIARVKAIYKEHKWTRYLDNDTMFASMFTHSLATYVYEENNTIIGLIRVVGDNTHILYIQDILVAKTYLRQGVGTALIQYLLDTYSHVRQKVLITDKTDTTAHQFYESLGFKPSETMNITCFVHFS